MSIEKNRIHSIDVLRGIIMIVMALDHTRDYFHADALLFDPTDLARTTPSLFFTRWITHFCAPAFALLSGISICINVAKKGRSEMARYLVTRGVWLVFLDLVVLRFGFFFNFYYDITFFSILWMLGWCMVLMAAVIFLPRGVLLAAALAILFGHDALGLINVDGWGPLAGSLWKVIFTAGFVPPAFVASYPVVPWLAIMMLGFWLGQWYSQGVPAGTRAKLLLNTGVVCVALFVAFRLLNWYGDPRPWTFDPQHIFFSFLSFINTTKYPVSMLFTLMTLGPLLLVLAWLEQSGDRPWKSLASVYGRVPLFYFLLHFYLIHAVALVVNMIRTGRSWAEVDLHFSAGFGGIVATGGVSLGWVYVAWIGVVTVLYPVCRWYDRHKQNHSSRWLSYL